ncbi:MAG TPA: hypothetical protein VKT28_04275 [Puia sp.]|nr:hypothetical protein [Puia sp.]
MRNALGVFCMIIIVACSCKNNTQKNGQEKKDEKKNFFPVNDYLKSEIQYVDSLPVGIKRYSTFGDKTDTAYIQSPEFNLIAKDFVCPELNPDIFEKEFSETSFIDETTHAATFTYATKNNKLELQRVDVLAATGDGLNKVSSVYLEKTIHKNDTLILKKLLWRTRTSFQIVTSTQISNQTPVVKQLKLVWGIE